VQSSKYAIQVRALGFSALHHILNVINARDIEFDIEEDRERCLYGLNTNLKDKWVLSLHSFVL
jgi:hypothetical protein